MKNKKQQQIAMQTAASVGGGNKIQKSVKIALM